MTSQTAAQWWAVLDAVVDRVGRRFRRREVRDRVRGYLAALLDRVERKNGWQLAEHLGELGPRNVQRVLVGSRWDADAVRDDLRAYVIEQLGTPDGVLIVDETGFVKKGTKSAGVQRQYSGTAGRTENCQLGVFLAYGSATGRAFLDRELYLPQSWLGDEVRCREAGIPLGTTFATKPELAQRMLDRARSAEVPAAWTHMLTSRDRRYAESLAQLVCRGFEVSRRVHQVIDQPKLHGIGDSGLLDSGRAMPAHGALLLHHTSE